jgi:hydroxypyruvate isomerase
MARYAANLSMLFTDVPFLRRFEAAASAGFEAVEFLWPSEEQLEGWSIPQLGAHIRSTGLQVPLFNFDAGHMSAGWRGLAGVPEARARFRANLPVAIGLATELGCRKLNALAGNAASVETRETQLRVLVEGLDEAAEMASSAGISVMLEALNPVDFPSYLVPDSATALNVVARTSSSNVRYQFDVYHAVIGREDPCSSRIIRVATSPARAPSTGGRSSTRSTRPATTTGSDSSTNRRILRPVTSPSSGRSAAGSPGRSRSTGDRRPAGEGGPTQRPP